jgi:tol-pal system protein YbgF
MPSVSWIVLWVFLLMLPESGLSVTDASDPARRLYDRVMVEFQHKDYEAALAGFRLFLELHRGSRLASSAQYWIGECEFRLRRYREAAASFEKVIGRYPKSQKVASATVKQALAYDKLGMATESRILLERVIVQFPGSPEADLARKALKP